MTFMQVSWRSTSWSKSVAASFIGLICLGNIWYVDTLFGRVAPNWLQSVFGANLIWLFMSAFGLIWHIMRAWLFSPANKAEEVKEEE